MRALPGTGTRLELAATTLLALRSHVNRRDSEDFPHSAFAALEPGFLVGGGRFTLLRLLGRGGMGVVWLARDEQLSEDVALKFLPPDVLHDAVALDDLRRETARSRRLTHPNIIRIHDFYRAEHEAFISMEFVDGNDLSDLRLQQPDRIFSWSYLEPLVKQLCDALDYAHGEKIVHRDLKPANMILDTRGRLKLADFGIAAVVVDSASRVTARHARSGTSTYMSPQQMDGRLPQVADDIYALGATLYELLTSRPPFFTGDVPHQVRTLAPQPLEERLNELEIVNPVPASVAAMIMACLAKEPSQRPASIKAVAEWIGLPTATVRPSTEKTQPAPVETVAPMAVVPTLPQEAFEETVTAAEPVPKGRTKHIALSRRFALPIVIAILAVAILPWAWKRRASSAKVATGAIPSASSIPAAPAIASNGFIWLFNGWDLTGWKGDTGVWSVVNGTLRGELTARTKANEPSALFWTGGTVEDFELEFSFRVAKPVNSGVYYRARELPKFDVGGYQFEIFRNGIGSLIEVGNDRNRRDIKRVTGVDRKDNAWQQATIKAEGRHLTHSIGGTVIVDTIDNGNSAPQSGVLALEITSGPAVVEFKDLRLRVLPKPR